MLTISNFFKLHQWAINQLNAIGTWLPQLALRIMLAWEFGEAGFEKLHGTNWFADLTFPFPFNILPAEISWKIALTFEILGAFALVLGLATRFFSISLLILTIVAIASVHWPEHWNTLSDLAKGYRIVDEENDGFGNYKLPVMYIFMLLPLIFSGAGKLSADYLLQGLFNNMK